LIILSTGSQTSTNLEDSRYHIWVAASEQTHDLQDSAFQRLRDDDIEYKLDKEGNLLIKEKDLRKAVICCL
jgi:hypothetical protein